MSNIRDYVYFIRKKNIDRNISNHYNTSRCRQKNIKNCTCYVVEQLSHAVNHFEVNMIVNIKITMHTV